MRVRLRPLLVLIVLAAAGLLRLGRPKDEIELGLQDASAHELMALRCIC